MINNEPFRRELANFQKNTQEIVEKMLTDELKNQDYKAREDYRQAVEVSLDQYGKIKYFADNDPEVIAELPGNRLAAQRRFNIPVKAVIKALIYCRDHPRATGDDLKSMKKTVFKGFPPHLIIEFLPILAMYGRMFSRLDGIQRKLIADSENEPEPEDVLMPERSLPAVEAQP